MKHLESVRHQLMESELLGPNAGRYGSPDELMLVSAGPISHLSQFSLLCGPTTRRVTIRQPPKEVVKAAKPHSPLSGEIQLEERIPFTFQREMWNGYGWETECTIRGA